VQQIEVFTELEQLALAGPTDHATAAQCRAG
jgi:hypothetical protein